MIYNGELQRIRELHWYKKIHDSGERTFQVSIQTASPLIIILSVGILVAALLLIYERTRNVTLNKLCTKLKLQTSIHLNVEVRSEI